LPLTAGEVRIAAAEKQIWDSLVGRPPVVVASHRRLDGDGVGTALALWHGLQGRGVESVCYFHPPVPEAFEFLAGFDRHVQSIQKLPERFTLVAVDCGALKRIGPLAERTERILQVINIDHHLTNDRFGDVNYVSCDVSSSGEMAYHVLKGGDVEITPEIAKCLYTAIVTDTGSFSYSNTTRGAFEISARLVQAGASPAELSERLFFSPPENVVRLKGLAIDTLQLEAGGRLATVHITKEMFEKTGTRSVDTQGFADIPVSVAGVEASALFKEIKLDGYPCVKVSLRSRASNGSIDVCEIARQFGGGGHRHAAGCELDRPLETARERIMSTLRGELPE
jgi:phosphoesterase RecJ-like protein